MFHVRKEQMDWFAQKTRRGFVERMALYLKANFAACFPGASDEAIEAWVADAVERSITYQVNTEPEAAQLILLFLLLEEDGGEAIPWVKEVLRDRELSAIGKVRRLIRRARAEGIEGLHTVILPEYIEAHARRE